MKVLKLWTERMDDEAVPEEREGAIGIQATAEIVVRGVLQRIHSPGLWGIDPASSEAYLAGVEREQRLELREILQALGLREYRYFVTDWDDLDNALSVVATSGEEGLADLAEEMQEGQILWQATPYEGDPK